jgi:radical SAM protein with 4Fe4S-binding SPASM domain
MDYNIYRGVLKALNIKGYGFWVFLTEICNCCCPYCIIDIDRKKIMSEHNFRRLLEIAKTLAKKDPIGGIHFTFAGGEPLLILPKYFPLLEEFISPSIRVSYSIITNGTLITPEIAKFMAEHNISARVSLDHPIHSKPLKNGKNAAEDTKRGIALLDEYGAHFGINSVFDDTWGRQDIDQLLEYLNSIKYFNDGSNIEKTMCITPSHLISDITKVTKLLELVDYCCNGIIKRNMHKVSFSGFRNDTSSWFCQAGRTSAAIDTDLNILPCQVLKKYPMKKFDEQFDEWFKDEVEKHGFKRELKPDCVNCELLHICRGGCFANSFMENGEKIESVCCAVHRGIWNIMKKYNFREWSLNYLREKENYKI